MTILKIILYQLTSNHQLNIDTKFEQSLMCYNIILNYTYLLESCTANNVHLGQVFEIFSSAWSAFLI